MATVVSSFVLHSIELLMKFLESRMTVFVHTRMSSLYYSTSNNSKMVQDRAIFTMADQ